MPYRIRQENDEYIVSSEGLKDRDAFVDAARGAFSLIYDIESARGTDERVKIVVEAKSIEELLAHWIAELIERQMIHEIVYADFSIVSIQKISAHQYLLTGAAHGEAYDRKKHVFSRPGIEVKTKGLSCAPNGKNHYLCEFRIKKLES